MNFNNNDSGYSRKEFLKRMSLGMGAAFTLPGIASVGSSLFQQQAYYYQTWRNMDELPDEEKLGIALVGLGSYAMGQLAPALQDTKLCRLTGLVTGTPSKEDKYGSQYNIPDSNIYNYETYDQIADNDDIDIIYVVLPNAMHAEYTIRGAEAGKHVISEKPMATSVEDAEAMIAACNKAGKKLSIGYRLHFEPHHQEVMRIGQNEVFGAVQSMSGEFSVPQRNPDVWRLDKELSGGGPLMDVGIYAVQAAQYTLGERPIAVTAEMPPKTQPELFDEVEETITWTLEFSGGIEAEGRSTYTDYVDYHNITAEEGTVRIEPSYGYSGQQGETPDGEMDFPDVNQQMLQMDAFADCILNGGESRVPGEMGLRDMKILMAIYEAAETGNRIEFDW